MKKVFLGGTTNETTWRDRLIKMLTIDYFNPVVKDWTPECQKLEYEEKDDSDFLLYVITPKMKGAFSIAEVVDDSNKRPEKTIFCFLKKDDGVEFDDPQIKSLQAVAQMVEYNGAKICADLGDVADYLNGWRK